MKVIDYQYGSGLNGLLHRHLKGMIKGITLKKSFNSIIYMMEKLMKKRELHSKPFYIKIEPTNCCDLRCPECPSLTKREKGFMDINLYKEIISYFKPYCLRNRLCGQGEPFLHPGIFEMISYSEQQMCPVSVISDFNNLTTGMLKKILDSGLNRLIVRLDAAAQETYAKTGRQGSLEKVIDNLSLLCDLKDLGGYRHPDIEVQTILNEFNRHEIVEISGIARDMGANLHTVKKNNNLLPYEKCEIKFEMCPYLWGSIFITWDGKICPCETDYTGRDLVFSEFKRIKKGENYWNSGMMRHARSIFIDRLRDHVHLGIRCEYCKFFPVY